MKITMRVNLGSIDAKAHGLDHTKLQQGMEAEVGNDAARWLINNGHAVETSKVVKQPDPPEQVVKVAAVAQKPTVLGVPQTTDDFKANPHSKEHDEEHEEHDESPVHDLPAHEAIDAIGRKRSKEQLEHIANNDTRPTVKAAAQKRLAEL